MVDKEQLKVSFQQIQDDICKALAECDGKADFQEDSWEREGGGGGRSRVIAEGAIFEKGGVNFSEVHGEVTVGLQKQLDTKAERFYATGVSIVIHPNHPRVPIIHMNVRYFELSDGVAWFGGGIDLTPHFIDDEDARFFHQALKKVCDQHSEVANYSKFKAWADDYFYLPHREETRGIGGVFYDHLGKDDQRAMDKIKAFTIDLAQQFAPVYTALVNKNRNLERTDADRDWQLLRRGRYVEFNLVHDRGTRFGLVSNGRTESILMSLPNTANWAYQHETEEGSEEARTLSLLKKGIDWV
jgi:coproporphyrinogen III oxidase